MARSNDLTFLAMKENLFTAFKLAADSYRDIALPDLINRNLERDCARTSDFFSLETRPCRARTVGRTTNLKGIPRLRRIFQVSPRPASLFSSHPLLTLSFFCIFISFSFPSPTSPYSFLLRF